MAYLNVSESDTLTLQDAEQLLAALLPYYEEKQITRVVIDARRRRRAAVEVLLHGARSQCEAVGVDFTLRELA